jgi:hypothetical protein
MSSLLNGDYRAAEKTFKSIEQRSSSHLYNYVGMHLAWYNNDISLAQRYAYNILDSFSQEPPPLRYQALAYIVGDVSTHFSKEGLDNVQRNMNKSKIDLKSGYADNQVSINQKEILDALDKMIKEKETPKIKASASALGNIPEKPAEDSNVNGVSGEGKVDNKKLVELEKAWGSLPEKERARAVIEITKDLPPKYRVVIEEFFKSLSK